MIKMKKTYFICLALLVSLVGLASGCTRQEDKVVTIGSMPTLSAAIYAVGVDKGFFEEAGINVELTVFRSATQRDGAATSGNLDGFMTDIMGAVNLYQKDFPFIMTSSEYEDFGLMVGQNSGATTKSSEGVAAKVGISENTIIEFIMDTYVNSDSGFSKDYEKVNIQAVPDRMGALLSGEVPMGIFPQPFIGIIKSKGGEQLLSTASEGLQPVVLVFDSVMIEEDPELIASFYEGYEKALAYMQETPYEDYMSALVNHSLATDESVVSLRLPLEQYGLRPVSESDYDLVIDWMAMKEHLDQPIAFDEITTTEFVIK